MTATTRIAGRRRPLAAAILACAIGAAAPALAGQESAPAGSIVLAETEYRIEGFVLEAALERLLDIRPGARFESLEELERYAAEKDRILKNERVLDLSSSVGFELLGEAPDGSREARVIVQANTSWAILALPFPKYSSDDGFSLAVRYKDYNFLGTLEPMTLSLDWLFDEGRFGVGAELELMPEFLGETWSFSFDGETAISGEGFSDADIDARLTAKYPWSALGLPWYVKPLLSLSCDSDDDEVVAKAGGSVGFAFDALLPWDLSTSLAYVYRYAGASAHSIRNGIELATAARLASLPYFGPLTYSPRTELYLSTSLADLAPDDLGWSLGHELSLDRVDWVGNFRRGASLSVTNDYTYHFVREEPSDRFDLETKLGLEAFYSVGNLIGVNARVVGRWFGTWTYLGEANRYDWDNLIRGYRNRTRGDIGIVANLELAVNVAQGRFFGIDALDAEIFVDPFLDLALVRKNAEDGLFAPANRILCGGCEVIIFPSRARAVAYRLSVGYNLGDFAKTGDFDPSGFEITLGLGTHF